LVNPATRWQWPARAGQQCHDPRLAEAEPRAVVALVDGGPGHLEEDGHIGCRACGCGFGVAQTPVGGFANCPEGMPVLGADAPPDPEVAGIADHRLGSQRSAFLEVLLETRRAVVDGQLRVDALGDDLGAERAGRLLGDPPIEDDRDLLGTAKVEVIADDAFEEGAARLRTIEHAGVGELDLAEGEVIHVAAVEVGVGGR
jgi:hypothetical protein